MTHVNKKLVHEYVDEWFNGVIQTNWIDANDWENDVFRWIAQYYTDNEFGRDWTYKHRDKLYSLIKNDPLYVKNYKQWWLKNALNKINKDF